MRVRFFSLLSNSRLIRAVERNSAFSTLGNVEKLVSRLPANRLLTLATLVAPSPKVRTYSGWYFGIAEANVSDRITLLRIAIWRRCRALRLQQPVVIQWYSDLRINAYLGNDISRLLFTDGHYEPNEFYFLSTHLKPGMIFLDVGANDGLYALFASEYVGDTGRVFAFEPSSREYARLQDNIALNEKKNIEALRLALSCQNGVGVMHIAGYEHEGQNTLGSFIYEGVEQLHSEQIPLRRLDDILAEKQIDHVDFMKIDVEGAEYTVLEGAEQMIRSYRPTLLLELSDRALKQQERSAAEVLSFLRALGYRILSFEQTSGMPVQAQDDGSLSSNIVAIPT